MQPRAKRGATSPKPHRKTSNNKHRSAPEPKVVEKVIFVVLTPDDLPAALRETARQNANLLMQNMTEAEIAEILKRSVPVKPTPAKEAEMAKSLQKIGYHPPVSSQKFAPGSAKNDEGEILEYGKNIDGFNFERFNSPLFDFLILDEGKKPRGWLVEHTSGEAIYRVRNYWDVLAGPRPNNNGYEKLTNELETMFSNAICTAAVVALNKSHLTANLNLLQRITDIFLQQDGKEIRLCYSFIHRGDNEPSLYFGKTKTQVNTVYKTTHTELKMVVRDTILAVRLAKLWEKSKVVSEFFENRLRATATTELKLKRAALRDMLRIMQEEQRLRLEAEDMVTLSAVLKGKEKYSTLIEPVRLELNRLMNKAKNGTAI